MKELIVVNNLKKTFTLSAKQQKIEKEKSRVRVAVDGLSFTAYGGEVFGLLGPNGAGKTTALRMLETPFSSIYIKIGLKILTTQQKCVILSKELS